MNDDASRHDHLICKECSSCIAENQILILNQKKVTYLDFPSNTSTIIALALSTSKDVLESLPISFYIDGKVYDVALESMILFVTETTQELCLQ